METHLAGWIKETPHGREADAILRACVHCGFCAATCPTYQLLGDELDGPRGRIYQIKQVLEGGLATRSTQLHLDRCLTCLGCETTCPSGVRYGRLLEIGREAVDAQVSRPLHERLARWLLREGLSRRRLFAAALALGRAVRVILPPSLRRRVPARRSLGRAIAGTHPRQVLLLTSCTQDALLPSIDRATARVLDALGVGAIVEPRGGCCGALRAHLSDPEGARAAARRNLDAWWPHLERGVEAIVMTASGCGVQVRGYAQLLAGDPVYAARAREVSSRTQDLCEWLAPAVEALKSHLAPPPPAQIAFHPPCTLQHGQGLGGRVESILRALGAELTKVQDAHLCCGSAGSYSLLQRTLANELRRRKLEALAAGAPDLILSANIGCLAHLAAGTDTPVRHWIEWIEARLAPRAAC